MISRMSARAARGLLLVVAAAVLALAGCSDDDGPPAGGTALETTRASSAAIGPDGGVLEATARDGTTYRLEIPPAAMPRSALITMTPVARLGDLPLSGGLVGAVDLEPSGLRFARPVTLTIGRRAAAPGGQRLTGFSIAGASPVSGELAVPRAADVVVLLTHFSINGAGFGTPEEIALLQTPRDLTAAEAAAYVAAIDAITTVGTITDGADPAKLGELRDGPAYEELRERIRSTYLAWYFAIVGPRLADADTDAELLDAVREYDLWNHAFLRQLDDWQADYVEEVLEPVRAQLAQILDGWQYLAALKYRQAITANDALCREQRDVEALLNVWFLWRSAVVALPLAVLEENHIDYQTLLQDSCARLVVTRWSLADTLRTDVSRDLDVAFGVRFEGQDEEVPARVRVAFSGVNAAFARPSPTTTNAQGELLLPVRAVDGNQPVTVALDGCLVDGGGLPTVVCVNWQIVRNSQGTGTIVIEVDDEVVESFPSRTSTDHRTARYVVPVDAPVPRGGVVTALLAEIGSGTITQEYSARAVSNFLGCYVRTVDTTVTATGIVTPFFNTGGLRLSADALGRLSIGLVLDPGTAEAGFYAYVEGLSSSAVSYEALGGCAPRAPETIEDDWQRFLGWPFTNDNFPLVADATGSGLIEGTAEKTVTLTEPGIVRTITTRITWAVRVQ